MIREKIEHDERLLDEFYNGEGFFDLDHQCLFENYEKLKSFFVTSSRSQLLALIAMLFLLILTLAYWNKKERGTSNLQPIIA